MDSPEQTRKGKWCCFPKRVGKDAASTAESLERMNSGASTRTVTSRTVVRSTSQLCCALQDKMFSLDKVKDHNIILKYYDIGRSLGKGAFGQVFEVTDKDSKSKRACKVIEVTKFDPKKNTQHQQWLMEIEIMGAMDHPNVVKIHDAFVSPRELQIVMDLCSGGDLFHFLKKQPDCRIEESKARDCFRQMGKGLAYLHSHRIAHRDLKLENFLIFKEDDKEPHLKLIDFGYARLYQSKSETQRVGTPYYMPPEIHSDERNPFEGDMWSLGCILYMMVTGQLPILGATTNEILLNLNNLPADVNFGDVAGKVVPTLSGDCKEVILRLMCVNSSERYTCEEVITHPWIENSRRSTSVSNAAATAERQNPTGELAVEKFTKFREKTALERLVLQIAVHRVDDTKILADIFSDMDADNNGVVSYSEFRRVMEPHLGSESEVKELFKAADFDKTENLNYQEFLAALSEERDILTKSECIRIFLNMDENKNGELTLAEIADCLKPSDGFKIKYNPKKMAEKILREVDLDKDGKVSLREFKKALRGATEGSAVGTSRSNDTIGDYDRLRDNRTVDHTVEDGSINPKQLRTQIDLVMGGLEPDNWTVVATALNLMLAFISLEQPNSTGSTAMVKGPRQSIVDDSEIVIEVKDQEEALRQLLFNGTPKWNAVCSAVASIMALPGLPQATQAIEYVETCLGNAGASTKLLDNDKVAKKLYDSLHEFTSRLIENHKKKLYVRARQDGLDQPLPIETRAGPNLSQSLVYADDDDKLRKHIEKHIEKEQKKERRTSSKKLTRRSARQGSSKAFYRRGLDPKEIATAEAAWDSFAEHQKDEDQMVVKVAICALLIHSHYINHCLEQQLLKVCCSNESKYKNPEIKNPGAKSLIRILHRTARNAKSTDQSRENMTNIVDSVRRSIILPDVKAQKQFLLDLAKTESFEFLRQENTANDADSLAKYTSLYYRFTPKRSADGRVVTFGDMITDPSFSDIAEKAFEFNEKEIRERNFTEGFSLAKKMLQHEDIKSTGIGLIIEIRLYTPYFWDQEHITYIWNEIKSTESAADMFNQFRSFRQLETMRKLPPLESERPTVEARKQATEELHAGLMWRKVANARRLVAAVKSGTHGSLSGVSGGLSI